jgi:hypothetical protein
MGILGLIAPIGSGLEATGDPASKVSATTKAAGSTGSIGSSGASGTLPVMTAKFALLSKIGAGLVIAGGASWWLGTREPSSSDNLKAPTGALEVPAPAPMAPPSLASAADTIPLDARPGATQPSDASNANSSKPLEPAANAPKPPSNRGAPASEAALLQRAQALLASNPTRALALTQEHASQFPKGQLVQEREVIRIEALRRLGREGQAEKVGRDFERQFPDSPHRRKLDQ